jgi:hypothetical protein
VEIEPSKSNNLKIWMRTFAFFALGLMAGVWLAQMTGEPGRAPTHDELLAQGWELVPQVESSVARLSASPSELPARGPASVPPSLSAEPLVENPAGEEQIFPDTLWLPQNFGTLRIYFREAQKRWFAERVRTEFQMPYYDFNPEERTGKKGSVSADSKFWKARLTHRDRTGHTKEFELRYYTGEKMERDDGISAWQLASFKVYVVEEGQLVQIGYGSSGQTGFRGGKEYLFLENDSVSREGHANDIFQYFMAPLPGEGGPAMFLSVAMSVWHTTEEFNWEPVRDAAMEDFLSE